MGVVKAAEQAPDNTPKSKFTKNDSSRESVISVQGGKNDREWIQTRRGMNCIEKRAFPTDGLRDIDVH